MLKAADLRRFEIPQLARVEDGPGGLVRIAVTAPLATAHITLHGAHVTHFQPAGAEPLLFMSAESAFAAGKPIRGGVPVIFPWFGPHSENPKLPAHGLVRAREWTLESLTAGESGDVTAVLGCVSSEATRAEWPHDFRLRFRVTVGAALQMELEVENTGSEPFTYEEALHTYLAVTDVRETLIGGLEGVEYIDKTDGMRLKQQDHEPIRIGSETDRVYLHTRTPCTVDDPGLRRRIVVEKSGSETTVVWNPWIAKSAALPGFGDEEWPGMICIETANAAENRVTLAAGASHVLGATVRSAPIP